jgi:hypothetical protein
MQQPACSFPAEANSQRDLMILQISCDGDSPQWALIELQGEIDFLAGRKESSLRDVGTLRLSTTVLLLVLLNRNPRRGLKVLCEWDCILLRPACQALLDTRKNAPIPSAGL